MLNYPARLKIQAIYQFENCHVVAEVVAIVPSSAYYTTLYADYTLACAFLQKQILKKWSYRYFSKHGDMLDSGHRCKQIPQKSYLQIKCKFFCKTSVNKVNEKGHNKSICLLYFGFMQKSDNYISVLYHTVP